MSAAADPPSPPEPGPVEFRLLGPLEALAGGRPLPLGGPRQRTLLAALLLSPGEAVSTDRLVEAVWDAEPPPSAHNLVQGYVSELRKALGRETIGTAPPGYALRIGAGRRDVDRFEELVEAARRSRASGDLHAAADAYGDALALWRGGALAEFTYARFAQAEIARLEEARLVALEERLEAELELGRHRELLGGLEALVAREPLRERPLELLMLALYRSGRQAEALEAFRQARERLVEELGLEPGPRLQELHRAVLGQAESLAPPAEVPVRRASLPAPASALVGRRKELAALRELVAGGASLVTITGPGGSGKTRLALELARALREELEERVHVVELAPLADPALVLGALAGSLHVRETAAEPLAASLARAVGADPTLVLLDNFEHVLDAAVPVAELVAACRGLRVVVTSRAALRVAPEREFPLDPLPVEEAVELFTQRARAVRPGFEPEEATLGEICRRLDGLPLAVELAAARTRVLAPDELLARLHRRLDVLTDGGRDAPARQQTLRAAVEWSHDLLAPEERRLFHRLSVFAGGCTIDAAEEVCGASLDALGSLIEKSLLRRHGSPSRYAMLETIREYAAEQLRESGAEEPVRQAHAAYHVRLAERALAGIRGPAQREALALVGAEIDNLRAALAWSSDHEPESAIRIAAALAPYWATRGHMREARAALEAALALPQVESPAGVTLLLAAGNFASYAEDFAAASELYGRGLALARTLGPQAVPSFLGALGRVALATGSPAEARARFEEALALQRAGGDLNAAAVTLTNLSLAAIEAGDLDAAEAGLAEGEAILRAAEAVSSLALLLPIRGYVAVRRGDRTAAARLLREGLEAAAESGNRPAAARSLVVAALALAEEEPGRAGPLLGASEAAWAEFGVPPERFDATVRDEAAALLGGTPVNGAADLDAVVASLLAVGVAEADRPTV